MDVAIALLAAKAQDVQALSWHHPLDRPANAVDPLLHVQVLRHREVGNHCFHVPTRAHERIPAQCWISVEKNQDIRVLVDHRRRAPVFRIMIGNGADEASAFPGEAFVVLRVERYARVAHLI